MKPKNLQQLEQAAQARFLMEQRKASAVMQRESNLRATLTLIQEQVQAAEAELAKSTEMQTVGAGILWQHWVARKRRLLNDELLQVLIAKNRLMPGFRTAFGRQKAAEELIAESKVATKKKRDKAQIARLSQGHLSLGKRLSGER